MIDLRRVEPKIISSVVRLDGWGTVFGIIFSDGTRKKLKQHFILNDAFPQSGHVMVPCAHNCQNDTKPLCCTHQKKQTITAPCRGQFYYLEPLSGQSIPPSEDAPKLLRGWEKSCQLIQIAAQTSEKPITWHVITKSGAEYTLKKSDILGYNKPTVGKYLLACHTQCAHRGGMCIKSEKHECNGQFFYVRQHVKCNIR